MLSDEERDVDVDSDDDGRWDLCNLFYAFRLVSFLRKSIIFHLLLSMFTFSPVSGLGQFSNIFMFIETQLSDY